jgi:predicted Zn-dependent protease
LLTGQIAAQKKELDQAIAELRTAQEKEYALRYVEPPAWPIPVRHYLGSALLDAGRPAEAEAVFKDDLVEYPENGFALHGLVLSQKAQNKSTEAADARFAAAWANADAKLTSARF